MKSVGIVRSDYPVVSEPFITEQINNFGSWRPVVICRRLGAASAEHPGCVSVSAARSRLLGVWPQAVAKSHISAAVTCELLHAHFGPDGVYARALALRSRKPYIVTFHGYDATLSDRALLLSRQPSKLHFLIRRNSLIRDASLIVAVSNFIRRKLIDRGTPEHKVITHYIGVDTKKFMPLAKYRTRNPVLLITVARLVASKAIDIAIRAVAALRARGIDCRYEIIGDGPLRHDLICLSKRLRVDDLVCFVGALPHREVVRRICLADIFLFPSRPDAQGAEEALGIVLLEAAACAIPIVACDVGGIGEAVRNGKNGYLVPAGDELAFLESIVDLICNVGKREAFGAAGRQIVRDEFDIVSQSAKLEELYDRVAQK